LPSGEGAPKGRMRVRATHACTRHTMSTTPHRTAQSPARCCAYQLDVHITHQTLVAPSSIAPSIAAKTHHTRLREISWLLLANRCHPHTFNEAASIIFSIAIAQDSDEPSRLVRITNRLNANFSSWSYQMQTDPTDF
ncbi:hypothetical protein, partial [Xanthomonas vasicola]|uniref:hypothetical protein n=2 Tax=Xanthomonas vasicola TaxID=56459 RepID=UPI001C10D9A1